MMYLILRDNDEDSLAQTVTSYITDGWRPCGGVTFTFCYIVQSGIHEGDSIFAWAQAMTRVSVELPET